MSESIFQPESMQSNTLDAQRESAECYIKSQEDEGWICLPYHYDDGGYTSVNMDRPALKHYVQSLSKKSTSLSGNIKDCTPGRDRFVQ